MELARRIGWIALSLPVAAAVVATLARPAPPGVLAAGVIRPEGCVPALAGGSDVAAWSRLDAVLDAGGTLAAQQLTIGRGAARWTETLPPESFVSAPVHGRVLVGDDDGHRSRLRLLDTATGCWTPLGDEVDVVRSAVLAADGAIRYEHRVERGTRRDLGVWRASATGTGAQAASAVLPGLADDPAFGRTFATSLLVANDGRLLVSACGLEACRIRVLDPISHAVRRVDGTGPAVRVDGPRLVVEAPCEGLPCPLESVDLASGERTQLGEVVP